MEVHDTYVIENKNYNLEIKFVYYEDSGTWETQPTKQLDIDKVHMVGYDSNDKSVRIDITDFFFDSVGDIYDQEIIDYARDN